MERYVFELIKVFLLGAPWENVSVKFADYPVGVRQLHVTSTGVDTQFWAGHYGSKFANTSVIISFPPSVELKDEGDADTDHHESEGPSDSSDEEAFVEEDVRPRLRFGHFLGRARNRH